MRSIETQATLSAEGILTVKIPFDIPPGEHWVVIVIEEKEKPQPLGEFLGMFHRTQKVDNSSSSPPQAQRTQRLRREEERV